MELAEIIDRDLVERGLRLPEGEVERIRRILRVLGTIVQPDDRAALTAELELPDGAPLLAEGYAGPRNESSFFADVEEATGLSPGEARELTEMICTHICQRISPGLRERLERHADPSLVHLWRDHGVIEAPAVEASPHHPPAPQPGQGHTLASGRPGSRHPVSEAGPPAHPDSVVANPDPYGDRKLSSARGFSAEQKGRTLSEGRSGSEHPVSKSTD